MKRSIVSHVMSALALFGIFLGVGGCASPGYEKGAKTVAGLKASAERIEAARIKVDELLTSLNDLSNNPAPDLRPQYARFSDAVEEVDSMAKAVAKSAEDMDAKGQAYFEEWDKELATIKNEDIKSRNQARKDAVAANFENVKNSYQQVRATFQPYMQDLKDIQTALKIDLTRNGLEAVKPVIAKANQNFVPLKESVAKLSAQFKELGVALSPATEEGKTPSTGGTKSPAPEGTK